MGVWVRVRWVVARCIITAHIITGIYSILEYSNININININNAYGVHYHIRSPMMSLASSALVLPPLTPPCRVTLTLDPRYSRACICGEGGCYGRHR